MSRMRTDPNSSTALWNLALVLEQDQNPQEAEKLYARMIELSPDAEDARFRLGCLRLGLGDYRAAGRLSHILFRSRHG